MAKREVIQNFQEGMGLSPHTGFAVIKGMQIWDNPGECRPLNRLQGVDRDATNTDLTSSSNGIKGSHDYCHDSEEVFSVSGSGVSSIGFDSASNNDDPVGLYKWKGYLVCATSTDVWCYDSSADTWTEIDLNFSDTLNTAYRPMVHFVDDALYIGGGRYVARLKEASGKDFDPTDNTTYEYTEEALDLPENYEITQMVSYGNRLYIGTASGNMNEAVVFSWDGYSDSFYLPLTINEDDVNHMIVSAGQIYIQAGTVGNWYYSNGSSIALFKQMPDIFNYDGNNQMSTKNITVGAVEVIDDIIYFGVAGNIDTDGDLNIDQVSNYSGVWALDTREERLFIAWEFSESDAYTFDSIIDHCITDVWFYQRSLYMGWYVEESDGTKHIGLDLIDLNNNGYDAYINDNAYIISRYYQMGTVWNQYTVKQPELHLAEPFPGRSNQQIRVYYRKSLDADWTLHATLNNTGQSHFVMNDIPEVINIQFKIVVNDRVKLLKMLI